MELQLNKKNIAYLHTQVRQVQSQEQTQELRLSEEFPDIGRVLCAWGQSLIRSKEWRGDGMVVSGGVNASVLYLPEDGSGVKCVESWIPFQSKWTFPQTHREGAMRVQCLLKCVEARTVSARKLMLRVGVDVLGEAFAPTDAEIHYPGEMPESVELLTNVYPVVLPKEAGEKQFFVEEEIRLPDVAKWIHFSLEPKITEQSVVGSRVVMRGIGLLRYAYIDEQGGIRNGTKEISLSQVADLDGEYDKDATADVTFAVSGIEPEIIPEGVRLQCGLVSQYLIRDRMLLVLAEDAYSPSREVIASQELLCLPLELDNRMETMEAQSVFQGGRVLSMNFMPQQPIGYRENDMIHIEVPGAFHFLYQDYDGNLQSATENWTGEISVPAAENCQVFATIQSIESTGSSCRIHLNLQAVSIQQMPMICELKVGERKKLDDARPSLVLQRMEGQSLWELAKSTGSTMAAIRKANHLSQDPAEGQMLLIPIL